MRGVPSARAGRARLLAAALALALVSTFVSVSGCATREVKQTVVDTRDVTAFLREHKRGFEVIERDFQHPADIAIPRLVNILGAIDVRSREDKVSQQRAAFEPTQLQEIAEGLATALLAADPDQEVAVLVIRKEMQHYIFDRKHLTSFVAYVQDGLLYLHFSRVDWEVDQRVKKNALPEPRVNDHPMRIQVIPAPGMFAEGNYAVSVEWRDDVFKQPLARSQGDEGRRERTILEESADMPGARRENPLPADLLPYLTPTQLRDLADLEEARQNGRISEGRYRRERERILQAARKEEAATSR